MIYIRSDLLFPYLTTFFSFCQKGKATPAVRQMPPRLLSYLYLHQELPLPANLSALLIFFLPAFEYIDSAHNHCHHEDCSKHKELLAVSSVLEVLDTTTVAVTLLLLPVVCGMDLQASAYMQCFSVWFTFRPYRFSSKYNCMRLSNFSAASRAVIRPSKYASNSSEIIPSTCAIP